MAEQTDHTKFPPVTLVIMAVLLWSTGGLFIKLTDGQLDAYQVTFFRSLFAAFTVLILTRKDGLKINAFGILTSIIYALLLFLFVWATKKTTAANAIFLQYTAPIYILIFAPFIIGEKFHWRDLFTVLIVLAGMSLFFVGQLRLEDYQGNTAALFSGVFLGLYIMLLRHPKADGEKSRGWRVESGKSGSGSPELAGERYESSDLRSNISDPKSDLRLGISDLRSEIRDRKPMNPAIAVIYGNFLLALLTAPSAIFATVDLNAIPSFTIGILPSMTALDWTAVIFLGIFQIGISYILFIKGVRGGTRPLDASLIGFIEPLLNPVWVFAFVGERPSQWALLGGIVIIAAIAIHTLRQYAGHRAETRV